MKDRCTATADTVCVPCQDQFFSSEHHHSFCNSCTICQTWKGSVELKKCEKTSDRLCMCRAGYMPVAGHKPGSGSLSLILICLILLMVSGMSILLLIIQAAKKGTKRKPCKNNHQERSFRIPIQEEHVDSNSSLIKN
ncbi:Tnfrsf4 [Columba guinea]|nr:Tnfrsf4 [Columba guinea]